MDGPSHPKLHCYLHPGNGAGFLAALANLRCPSWADLFTDKDVTAEERRALRSVLLQVRLKTSRVYLNEPETDMLW